MRSRLSLLIAAFLLFCSPAAAATLHATPSTFASMYSGAAGGDTILLSAGSYGSFNGGAKSSMVTVAPETGASVSFSSSTFQSTVRNLTIRGVTYTGTICVNTPSGVKMNLILDGITMGTIGQGCNEGRLGVTGPGTNAIGGNGVQVKNSTFGPGGCSDGIQDSSHGTEIGPGNDFHGLAQGCPSSQAHVDPIQPYDGDYAWIHDNYIHGNEQGIMSPDGLSVGYLIENNVIDMASTGYYCMHLGDTRTGTVRHNVCINGGGIRLYGGNQNVASQNMVVQDNASPVDNISCTGCTVNHNQSVTFTGGLGRCGYATSSPKGTASDGTDIGLNDCAAGPPPPPPPPPPDTTAPDTTIVNPPANSTSDRVTWTFTSTEAGSTFECRINRYAFTPCSSPKLYTGQGYGTYTFQVRATDAAGNVDQTPATGTWTRLGP